MYLKFKDDLLRRLSWNVELRLVSSGRVVDRRRSHNIWTNIGRNYIAKFLRWTDAACWGAGTAPTVEYIGVGIGSEEQTINIASAYPLLSTTYPGQNIQSDDDPTLTHLERPVMIDAVDWLKTATYDAPGSVTNPSNVIAVFGYTFGKNDINLSGTYPVVPVSEVCLTLSDQTITDDPYAGGVAPSYVGPLRQVVCAYNGFAPLSKTVKNTLEVVWELRA